MWLPKAQCAKSIRITSWYTVCSTSLTKERSKEYVHIITMHMPQVFKSHGYYPQSNKEHTKNCNTLSRQTQVPAHNRRKTLFRHLMSFVKTSMFEDWLNGSLPRPTLEQHKSGEEHNSLAQSIRHSLSYAWYTKCKNVPIPSRHLSFLPHTSWMHDYNTVLNSKLTSYVEIQKSTR